MTTSSPNFFVRLAMVLATLALWTGTVKAADYFAAIAYSETTQQFGYAYGKTSLNSASRTALGYAKADDAEVVIYSRNAWCALARSNRGNGWGAAWSTTKKGAMAKALANCPGDDKRIEAIVFSGSE